jgi:two-component sensor histidine kinase
MWLAGDQYVLIVGDSGIGFPSDIDYRNTNSLGMQLLNTLATQLDGTVDLDRAGGTKFTIKFPVGSTASAASKLN